MSHRWRAAAALVAVSALGACSGGDEGTVTLERGALERGALERGDDEATTTRDPGEATAPPPTTTVATTTTTTGFTVAAPQPAGPPCPSIPAASQPDPNRPTYLMDVDVRPDEGVVEGRLTVRFTPDLPTDRLVFRLWPNGPRAAGAGALLEAGPVLLGSNVPAPTEQPDPTTLVVPLPDGLDADQRIEATVPWTLTLPGPAKDRVANQDGAVRLGSFFPILAWEPGVGWTTEPPTAAFAEASTAPVADYSYTVNVPAGYQVLASGTLDRGRWVATAHRDVAISAGRFTIVEGVAAAPQPVKVRIGVHEGIDDDPNAYLDRVVRSLTDFGARYGAYPYESFSLAVTPGFTGGIEYPGHVMQGPGSIGRTTPHEVAHQWFYGLVGNDQGRDPWLDEGLASWAEARFEGTLDAFAAKDIPGDVEGRTGQPMTFWESRQSSYYRGVYVQGALALGALGSPALVDCALRLYVAQQSFAIARPDDLVGALTQVFPDAEATLARFGALP